MPISAINKTTPRSSSYFNIKKAFFSIRMSMSWYYSIIWHNDAKSYNHVIISYLVPSNLKVFGYDTLGVRG
jgi:hypothetical protein